MTDDRRPGTSIPGRLSVSMSCQSNPRVSTFPGGAAPDGATDLRRGTSLSLPSPTGIYFSWPIRVARAPVSPDTLCGQGTYFFTYGLPAAASRCLAIVRKRPLASVRCSVPPGASAIRATDAAGESSASGLKHCRTARRKAKPTPMALGCCVGCATKKVSKKVAGNSIPRSRLPSERKIAHSRAGSLCPYFDTQ